TDGVQAGELGLAGSRWMVEGRPLPLGINAPGLDAAIRVALGEAQPDSDGRVPARRLAPVPASASVGTLPMRRVGDFYVDATEALVVRDGSARSVAGMVPTAANWFEADEACRTAGKRLCTVEEWRQACSGERFSDWLVEGRRWPYSDIWSPTLCWDSGNSTRTSAYETGQKPFCKSPEGVYDLTGNVWEWVGLTPGEAQLLGGSFLEGSNATCSAVLEGFGPRYSAPWTGFRCCAVQAVEATGAGLAPRSESSGGFPLPMEPDTSRVLVHVVQSGCPACAHSTRALAKLQEQGESTRVIAVGLGVDERELKRLLRPSGLQSKELPDPEGRWTGALRVVDLPTTLVLAETGQERARMEGFSQQGWRALLEALQVDEER
ncbi:MAG: SUMF1/EgtB/PvdO family nonheme iron enzyme, partial [Bacteroidota bacterium]|nr:SUMF1/EgtB/PvdO family nonheme iron enzyme [Bacteroidota bacterium]